MLRIHSRILLALWFSVVIFGSGAQQAHATTTYIVGTCKTGTTFSTIQAALDATPAPNIVEVCPGSYPQQITITKPVTLEGIVAGGNDQAIITVPAGGLVTNATVDVTSGEVVAAQIFVEDTAGVDISNIVINGTGNKYGPDPVIGIYYENSSGTVSHTEVFNQAEDGNGVGIWLEGGSSHPTVTVEECSIHGIDSTGILTETNTSTSELTAKITGNLIVVPAGGGANLFAFYMGTTVTASGNYLDVVSGTGIFLEGAEGTIMGNVIVGGGVLVAGDSAISLTSNKILNAAIGVWFGEKTTLVEIQGNTIMKTPTAIELGCFSTSGKVHSNTIIDANTGVDHLQSGNTSANTYFDVGTEVTNCSE
jgi:hypothetical protein